MPEFKNGEILTLYYIDDVEMKVTGKTCRCTNPKFGQFWLEDQNGTVTFGIHLFLTEREALEVALKRFTSRAERYKAMAADFETASIAIRNALDKLDQKRN